MAQRLLDLRSFMGRRLVAARAALSRPRAVDESRELMGELFCSGEALGWGEFFERRGLGALEFYQSPSSLGGESWAWARFEAAPPALIGSKNTGDFESLAHWASRYRLHLMKTPRGLAWAAPSKERADAVSWSVCLRDDNLKDALSGLSWAFDRSPRVAERLSEAERFELSIRTRFPHDMQAQARAALERRALAEQLKKAASLQEPAPQAKGDAGARRSAL